MNKTINQRFKYACEVLGLTQKDLVNILGSPQSSISKMLNGVYPIGKNMLFRIKETLDINPNWLLTGEGEMLKSNNQIGTAINNGTNNGNIIGYNNGNRNNVVAGNNTTIYPAEEKQMPNSDVVRVPFVGKNLAASPDFNIRELVKSNSPLLEKFPFNKMVKGIDYIQTVITMAMAPRYLPGDYLFVSFNDETQIVSGKIYLVDTRLYGTVFRHVYIEEDGYTLKAANPEFKDIFVKKEDIYSISSVPISVNTNTSLTSEVNLSVMVQQRDAALREFVDSNQQLIKSQDELIAEVRKQNERLDQERARQDKLLEKQSELIDILLKNK